MPHVTLYTDGSWKKGYMAGGWACLMTCGPHIKLIADGEQNTTNNRQELTAILRGLQNLVCPCAVTIISDSQYAVNCINKWIAGWDRNGWKNSDGDPVSNIDILVQIKDLMKIHQVRAKWIKAHTNRKGIDYLGNATVDTFAQLSSTGMFEKYN